MSKAIPIGEEILLVITSRFETAELAFNWLETELLSGFGGQTGQQLIEAGRGQELLDYIEAVDVGIHT